MVIHPTSIFGLKITKQLEFYKDGMDLIASSRKRFFNKPYRLLTTLGEVIVLPAYYGGVIHNDRRLNFRRAVFEVVKIPPFKESSLTRWKDTGGDVSGFEPFAYLDHPTEMIQKMVKNHLTVYLSMMLPTLKCATDC